MASPTSSDTAPPPRASWIARWLLAIAVLSVVGVAAGFVWPFGSPRAELALPGTAEVYEVRLSSKVGGRIAAVLVEEGQELPAGQAVVRFDAPELHARKQRLDAQHRAAQAALDKAEHGPRPEEIAAARATAKMAEARWKMMQAGSRPQDVEHARAELETWKPDLKRAESDLARARRLVDEKVLTPSDLANAEAEYGRLSGQIRTARARLDLLEAGFRSEEIDEAAAKYEQAKASLDLLLAGTRAEDIAVAFAQRDELRAQLAELQTQLEEAVVTAPESCVVEVVAVRPGEVVAPNQPVVRVLRKADLWVKAYVPETDLGHVKLNQQVAVTIDSQPGQRFIGHVTYIASVSEFTPRNVQSVDERRHQVFGIKVQVDAPPGVLKSGMAADVLVPR